MTITPEVRAELLTMLRQEMAQEEQRKKENRNAYSRIYRDFEQEFSMFDYTEIQDITNINGDVHRYVAEHPMAYKIRNAIGALLRSVYQANSIDKLPADKENEMREFTSRILSLMKSAKETAQSVDLEFPSDREQDGGKL